MREGDELIFDKWRKSALEEKKKNDAAFAEKVAVVTASISRMQTAC